jgi:hypothetical protein
LFFSVDRGSVGGGVLGKSGGAGVWSSVSTSSCSCLFVRYSSHLSIIPSLLFQFLFVVFLYRFRNYYLLWVLHAVVVYILQ